MPCRRSVGLLSIPGVLSAVNCFSAEVFKWNTSFVNQFDHLLLSFQFPGIGALYVRRRPRVRLEALISGGGQER